MTATTKPQWRVPTGLIVLSMVPVHIVSVTVFALLGTGRELAHHG